MSYLEILKRAENGPETNAPAQVTPQPVKVEAELSPEKSACKPALPALPESVLVGRYPLAVLCRATLDANPAAAKLSKDERRWLAEHLEAAVLGWLVHVFQPEYAWEATCPKGHRVTDGVFARCLLGWCCEGCKTVHPPEDCKLKHERKE